MSLLAASILAAAAMQPAPADTSNLVLAHTIRERVPIIIFGFFVHGSEENVRRLHSAAQGTGLPSEEVERQAQIVEWAVMLPRGADRAAFLNLYRQALRGQFGALRVEVTFVPVAEALDGIEMDEFQVLEAAEVAEPN